MSAASRAWGRMTAYWRGHVLLRDGLPACLLTWVLCDYGQAPILNDGFIFPSRHVTALTFSLILGLPLIFRRSRPEPAAQSFVAICLAQLLIGPTLLICDALGLIMLYSVITYGPRKQGRRYALTGFSLVALAALLNALAYNFGPLLEFLRIPGFSETANHGIRPACAPSSGRGPSDCLPNTILRFAIYLSGYALLLLLVIILAHWNRARRQSLDAMRKRNEAIEYRQREQDRLAASAERARIARDMHDLVAHTLSIVIVQSDAGRYAGAKDPALALKVMETIRREAGRALRDLDGLFGSFADAGRTDDGHTERTQPPSDSRKAQTNNPSPADAMNASTSRRPTDTYAPAGRLQTPDKPARTSTREEATGKYSYTAIDGLVRQARTASPDLRLERTFEGTPEPDELSAEASLVAYRCVQEALSNIRKHAGTNAHAVIHEHWSARDVRISISDDGRGGASRLEAPDHHGYGLLGMRERVEAIGGSVQAGPLAGGGFLVEALIPFGSQPNPTMTPSETVAGTEQPPGTSTGPLKVRPQDTKAALVSASPYQANPIERLSAWAGRHYLLVDAFLLVPFLLLMTVSDTSFFALDTNLWEQGNMVPTAAVAAESACLALPLVLRRRTPNLSAAVIATVGAVELIAVPWLGSVNLLVLVSIYSATAYGRGRTRIWVPATVVTELALMYLRLRVEVLYGSTTLLAWAMGERPGPAVSKNGSPAAIAGGILAVSAICCTCALVLGLWRRVSGSSILLLQEREEALRQGEAQRRRLAANAERARIGADIQAEVSATLSRVIAGADAGIALIVRKRRDDSTIPADDVDQAFETIGQEGRAALARMRQLLDILRQSGSSDADHKTDQASSGLRLHPVGRSGDGS
ncbi:sensor histidine kinase [Bifidobacterium xylocopae]|nr:histidine kinase [Bifidobacterium xylocopae]